MRGELMPSVSVSFLHRCLALLLFLVVCGCAHITIVSPRALSPVASAGPIDLAHVACAVDGFELDTLRQGVRAFRNRRYSFFDIPEQLCGLRFTRTRGGEERAFPITVRKSGVLLAAVMAPTARNDNQFGNKLMAAEGWSPTQWSFRYTDRGISRLRVWSKHVERGAVERIPRSPGTWTGVIVIAPVLQQLEEDTAAIEHAREASRGWRST